jgi:holin-like protein|tara:strand:- start:125 stop:541 length:417 start_codon:yes stop_codon:yes gene_type:complete
MRAIKRYFVGALLVFLAYSVGVSITYYAALPVPSALVGLLLLLFILFKFPSVEVSVSTFVTGPLKHMSLFFVPAVMGVSLFWDEISSNALAIGLAIILTTAISLLLTAQVAQRLLVKKDSLNRSKTAGASSEGAGNDQ